MKLDRFINRPVLSTVISIVIVILGILGLISLPISQYPDIAPPTVSVSTTYQGANAQTVLNSVVAPLEEQINGVENMMYMSSTATNTGEARIDGRGKRSKPRSQSTRSATRRSNQSRRHHFKTTDQYVAGILFI